MLIVCYLVVTFLYGFVYAIITAGDSNSAGLRVCDPKYIRESTNMSVLGAFVLSAIANLVFGIWALGFWIYRIFFAPKGEK